MRLTPDPEQEEAIERMLREPTRAALNASQYGTGKTLVTIEVAGRLGGKINLIACPLFTKFSWESSIKKQYPDAQVYHINSLKKGRENLERMLAGEPGWYLIGREYLMSKKVVERVQKFSIHIDFMAYDECAKWANRKSAGFKHMKKMKPQYKMALSATPAANKFDGLYAITKWLWPTLVPNSYWSWVGTWCATEEDYFRGTVVAGEKNPGEYVNQLPCYVRLTKDFGDPIEDRIEVELAPKERAIYDKFEKRLIVWLGDNPLVAKFPITKRIRLRQMSLGELQVEYLEDGSEVVSFPDDMKSSKYDALVGILKEYDEPALILTDSAKFARVVSRRLAEDGFAAMEWSGQMTEEERHVTKIAFEEDLGVDYIVATIPSIGEGVDGLQHRARLMIWLSRSDNNMLNEQAFRRLYRRGQTKQVVSLDIVARDTYDDGQLSDLMQQALDMNKSLQKEKS